AWAQAHLGQCLLLAIDADALLFSRTEPEERVRFWAQLAAAAQQDTLHLVLTVRSDRWYVGDAADGDANAPVLPSADCYPLASMERDALRQVIEQPAAQQGFSFAPAGALVDGLLDAVEHQPAALPLLNETLLRMVRQYIDRMQRRRLPDDNTLTAEDNLALGGVNGVVADLANTYYEGLPADDRQAMQHVLLRLVDVNDSNQIVLRDPVEQAEFHYADPLATARAAAVIAGLAEQGLVVISADAEGPRCVQLGHSALIDTWSELRGWLVDSSQQWGLQRDLRGQVGRWLADNKEKTKLWHADPKLPQVEETLWPAGRRREGLQERLRWEKRVLFPPKKEAPAPDAWVNGAELEFVRESVRERSGFRQKLFGAVTVFVVVVFLLSGLALWQRGVALENERIALAKQAVAEREARRALAENLAGQSQLLIRAENRPGDLALILARDAWLTDHTVNADRALRNALGSPHWRRTFPPTSRRHQGAVHSAVFSPDGQWIVSGGADGTIRTWRASDLEPQQLLFGHDGWVNSVATSPDGAQILSGGEDGTVRVWDVASGQQTGRLEGHAGPVYSVATSPDGAQILSGESDGTMRVWDAASGQQTARLDGHAGWVWSVAYSPDGTQIVSGGDDGTVRVWDAASGQQTARLDGHAGTVLSVATSPDGAQIVSGGYDGTVRVW
ncbi:MAG: WD40 repeat domain-containing protein, partial [Anaerolineae bacterium]